MIEFVTNLEKAWAAHLGSLRGPRRTGPLDYVYASRRKSCVRAMALDLLHPEDSPEFPPAALERMERGKERESSVVARLMQIGPRMTPPWEVTEGQRRFEIKDRDGTVLIVGKIDGRLMIPDGEGGYAKPVFEVKAGRSFENCRSVEDLDRGTWTRHTVDQLLAYLYAEAEPWGILILETAGLPTFIPVPLADHLERVEAFLKDAAVAVRVRRAIEAAGEDPIKLAAVDLPPFSSTPGDCRRCDHYGKSCDPQLDYGSGISVIQDETLEAAARVRERTADAARAHAKADKLLKDRLRGVEAALMGPFAIKGKWGKSTKYDVPADVKAPYKVENPQGRFTLNVERIAEDEPEDAISIQEATGEEAA